MDYKVVLAPRAIEDLRDIVLYVAPDRPEAAKRLGLALIERTKVLSSFPLSGRVVPEFDNQTIRGAYLKTIPDCLSSRREGEDYRCGSLLARCSGRLGFRRCQILSPTRRQSQRPSLSRLVLWTVSPK